MPIHNGDILEEVTDSEVKYPNGKVAVVGEGETLEEEGSDGGGAVPAQDEEGEAVAYETSETHHSHYQGVDDESKYDALARDRRRQR